MLKNKFDKFTKSTVLLYILIYTGSIFGSLEKCRQSPKVVNAQDKNSNRLTQKNASLNAQPEICKQANIYNPEINEFQKNSNETSQNQETITNWANKIFSLKERPIELSSLPTHKEYQAKILKLNDFLTSITDCVNYIKDSCKNINSWINNKNCFLIYPELSNLNRSISKDINKNFIFAPYAQKLIVQPGSKIIIFGDLHGSAHCLIRSLKFLIKKKYLQENFKLQNKNYYMLFLGDYVDRGIYGTEVINTIVKLKIANKDQVFIIRGNHEDYTIAANYVKKNKGKEIKDIIPDFIQELRCKFNLNKKQEIAIYRFYDILPVVLYLGCPNKNGIDFIHCCHGGLELGYTPHKLLNSNKKFEYINLIKRKTNYEKLTEPQKQIIKKNFDIKYLCHEIQDLKMESPIYKLPGTEHTTYFGLLWNDFFTNPKKELSPRPKRPSGWVYGANLTKAVLNLGNSRNNRVCGIFRAHQHNNNTGGPMLDMLCCNKGAIDIWKDKLVFSFLSAPSSILEDTGENCFTYDSFAIITTACGYSNWYFEHYWQDSSLEYKKWVRSHLKS